MIENRKRWKRMDNTTSFFQTSWKPKSWGNKYRFIFVRTRRKIQKKGPVQLDLFEPYDHEYEYSVVITNKRINAKKTLAYHHGRGSQESIFAELKSQLNMVRCKWSPMKKRGEPQKRELLYGSLTKLGPFVEIWSSERVGLHSHKEKSRYHWMQIISLKTNSIIIWTL